MSDQTSQPEQSPDESASTDAASTTDPAQESSVNVDIFPAQDADTTVVSDPVDATALTAEIQELKDKLLRAMAETENTRRIAAREKQDASKYALTNFARDILRVADNLGFAMMSVSEDARQTDKNLDNLFVGIDMTMKELLSVFESHGIKPVPAEGQPFDHNIHEAVQQVENPDLPANTVMKMLRGGYMLQDRLLRPAQVIVSTGGAKPTTDKDPKNPEPETAPGDGQQAYEPEGGETGQTFDQET